MSDTGSARNGNDQHVPGCNHSEIELRTGKMRSSLKSGLLFWFIGNGTLLKKLHHGFLK